MHLGVLVSPPPRAKIVIAIMTLTVMVKGRLLCQSESGRLLSAGYPALPGEILFCSISAEFLM